MPSRTLFLLPEVLPSPILLSSFYNFRLVSTEFRSQDQYLAPALVFSHFPPADLHLREAPPSLQPEEMSILYALVALCMEEWTRSFTDAVARLRTVPHYVSSSPI